MSVQFISRLDSDDVRQREGRLGSSFASCSLNTISAVYRRLLLHRHSPCSSHIRCWSPYLGRGLLVEEAAEVVLLAERDALRAQDGIGHVEVEEEVGQAVAEAVLAGGQLQGALTAQAQLDLVVLAAVDVGGLDALQQVERLLHARLQLRHRALVVLPVGELRARHAPQAVLGRVRRHLHLEAERQHVLRQLGSHIAVRVEALLLGVRLGLSQHGSEGGEAPRPEGHGDLVEGEGRGGHCDVMIGGGGKSCLKCVVVVIVRMTSAESETRRWLQGAAYVQAKLRFWTSQEGAMTSMGREMILSAPVSMA